MVARFATLGVVDLDNDIVEKGAVGDQSVLLGAYNHNFQSLPPGYGSTYETRTEAMFRGYFLDNSVGDETYRTLKQLDEAGINMEWSWRFFVEEGGFETRKGEEYYVIRKAKITHVAPVESAAGINTGTVELKHCGPECQANKAQQLDANKAERLIAASKAFGLPLSEIEKLPVEIIAKAAGIVPATTATDAAPQQPEAIDYAKMATAVGAALTPILNAALGLKSGTDGDAGIIGADGAQGVNGIPSLTSKDKPRAIEKGTLFLANGGGRIDIDTSTAEGRAALTGHLQEGMSLTEAVMAVAQEQGISVIPVDKATSGAEDKGANLGDLIRRLQEEKELSNETLAEAAGISLSTLGGVIAGTTTCPDCISPGRLAKLASALGTSLSVLAQAAEDGGCTCYGTGPTDSDEDTDGAKGAMGDGVGDGTDGGESDDSDGTEKGADPMNDLLITRQVQAFLNGGSVLPVEVDPATEVFAKFKTDFLNPQEEYSHAGN